MFAKFYFLSAALLAAASDPSSDPRSLGNVLQITDSPAGEELADPHGNAIAYPRAFHPSNASSSSKNTNDGITISPGGTGLAEHFKTDITLTAPPTRQHSHVQLNSGEAPTVDQIYWRLKIDTALTAGTYDITYLRPKKMVMTVVQEIPAGDYDLTGTDQSLASSLIARNDSTVEISGADTTRKGVDVRFDAVETPKAPTEGKSIETPGAPTEVKPVVSPEDASDDTIVVELSASLKKLMSLDKMLDPIQNELITQGKPANRALRRDMLRRLSQLRLVALKAGGLVAALDGAKGRTAERAVAVKKLLGFLPSVQDVVHENLQALHADRIAARAKDHLYPDSLADRSPKAEADGLSLHLPSGPIRSAAMLRFIGILRQMKDTVKNEMSDPLLRDSPGTKLDFKVYTELEQTAAKMEAVMKVGQSMISTATTPQEAAKVNVGIQAAIKELTSSTMLKFAEFKQEAAAVDAKNTVVDGGASDADGATEQLTEASDAGRNLRSAQEQL